MNLTPNIRLRRNNIMGFASGWLEEKTIFPEFIRDAPDKDTGIIVVVPAYSEPGILQLIDSLFSCTQPGCKVEIIIVINAPSGANAESLEYNRQSIINIESWKRNHSGFFSLFVVEATPFVKEKWGVGMARKMGMDEAVRRFNRIDRPEGVILCLDADCTVKKNYFTAVYDELLTRKDRSACSIYFEHPLEGNDYPESVYRSITLYELHLRYYFQALAFTGFPYVHHTVGSAMAAKAQAYVRAGGMNRRMAGEDFYFIQKLVPAGGYFNLNRTTIFPSPRTSFRVPFGTGAAISQLTEKNSDKLLTYNIQAFKELKLLFSMIDGFSNFTESNAELIYSGLPEGLKQFTTKDDWLNKIQEIGLNTSGIQSFKKRFFNWFNMFRIVKYLNTVHSGFYKKEPVLVSASELLRETGAVFETDDPRKMLEYYRSLEKSV